jgi:hypothetical protein
MLRVDGYFLYQVGAAVRPLTSVDEKWSKPYLRGRLWPAGHWLDTLLNNSIYKLQTCRQHGNTLLETINRIQKDYAEESKADADKFANEEVGWWESWQVRSQSNAFETVFSAELQWGQLYLVEPKGGFDLIQLTENGTAIFPSMLIQRAPEAAQDAKDAARCIAFALPTAAAFHLHRLHELVLRRFYTTVTKGAPHPEKRNIESYIGALKNYGYASKESPKRDEEKKVLSALAGLKNFHRNPVVHPDDRLDDVEEAIALHGNIVTVVTYMLKQLPPEPLVLTPPPSAPAIEDKSSAAEEAEAE